MAAFAASRWRWWDSGDNPHDAHPDGVDGKERLRGLCTRDDGLDLIAHERFLLRLLLPSASSNAAERDCNRPRGASAPRESDHGLQRIEESNGKQQAERDEDAGERLLRLLEAAVVAARRADAAARRKSSAAFALPDATGGDEFPLRHAGIPLELVSRVMLPYLIPASLTTI